MTTTSTTPTSSTDAAHAQIADLALMTVKPRSLWADAWYRLVRNKASVAGMIIILLFTIVALFANHCAAFPAADQFRQGLPASGLDRRRPMDAPLSLNIYWGQILWDATCSAAPFTARVYPW